MFDDVKIVIASEFYKLGRTRSVKIIPVLLVIVTVTIFLAVGAASENLSFGIESAFYIFASSIGWIVKALAFSAIIISSFQISNEFSMGTVRAAWSHPVSRRSWYLGKLIHIFAVTAALLILSAALLLILTAFKYDFNPLIENEYMIHSEAGLWGRLLLSLLLTLWVTAVLVSAASAVALFFNSAGSSMAAVVAAGLLMVLLEIFSGARPFLLTTYISTPADQFTVMTKGLPLQMSWKDIIYHTVGFTSIYLAAALAAGIAAAGKREIRS
jgi:ABC-type transport system involved in multi-copper enzyme maturation permease subunit